MIRITKRPLAVTVVGHVDHGKTTLIDSIRRSDIATKEIGGITQSIGTYYFTGHNLKLLLIDTPGHQTFSHSRNYGINLSDLIILVVGLDDGVTPECKNIVDSIVRASKQTLVCLNKIDQYASNFKATKDNLTRLGLTRGRTFCFRDFIGTSGLTGEGVPAVLSSLRKAYSKNLLALVNVPARGMITDSVVDGRTGVEAKLIVQSGTLALGDIILADGSYGKVKSIIRFDGAALKKVGPYVPVTILGLPTVPKCGERFITVLSEQRAKEIVLFIHRKYQILSQNEPSRKVHSLRKDVKKFDFIVKAVSSTMLVAVIEALKGLGKKKDFAFRVISQGVGTVRKSDINLASATGATILTLGIRPVASTIKIVAELKLQLLCHQLIYELLNDLEMMVQKSIGQKEGPAIIGEAQVKRLFTSSTGETILGCFILKGIIKKSEEIRAYRNNKMYHVSRIKSLKQFKILVDEVRQGEECGMFLDQSGPVAPCVGDVLRVYANDAH